MRCAVLLSTGTLCVVLTKVCIAISAKTYLLLQFITATFYCCSYLPPTKHLKYDCRIANVSVGCAGRIAVVIREHFSLLFLSHKHDIATEHGGLVANNRD